jgi:polysaccharide export outer membrane protein
MERGSISMHNRAIPGHHKLVNVTATGIAATLFLLAQLPAALSQSSATTVYAPISGAGNDNRTTPGTVAQTPMVTVPEDFAHLKLAPGFLLKVVVYDQPDFSGNIRVDNGGGISIPFLGTLHVAGDTIVQAQDRIQQQFREKGILKNPQVTIDIQQFPATGATVLGEVQNPGRVQILTPHSLLDVIGLAGGETPLAGNEVDVKHADSSARPVSVYQYSRGSNGDSIRDVLVEPGDTVIVKRTGIVYVLGAVNRPGGYAMQEDGELNVAQAVAMAQGLAVQAKTGALRVVRHGPDGTLLEVPVPYNKIMNGKQVPMALVAGDIVYVPVSKIKAVFTTSSSLIGQTAAASIYVVR